MVSFKRLAAFLFFSILLPMNFPLGSAAHYVAGIVNNARDGSDANGKTVMLWQPVNGVSDNVTDIIGPLGNSGANNTYLIDCELLSDPCDVGDEVAVAVIDSLGKNVTGIIGGFGFDVLGNLTLNSAPNIASVVADDALAMPANEIDLVVNGSVLVTCEAVIADLDGEGEIVNASARFYHILDSFDGDGDDNNEHYSNSSCFINASYGNGNQSLATCNFFIQYYTNAGVWNCNVTAEDSYLRNYRNDSTLVNSLLALDVQPVLDYGIITAENVSDEKVINVSNYGNVRINLTLYGFGSINGDNQSLNCSSGRNISVFYEKYNLTASNQGTLTLSQFEQFYVNLTGDGVIRRFDLAHRQNDALHEAVNQTYWRVYLPKGIGGNCTGNIVFAAVQAGGS